MRPFLGDNFLLQNAVAERLYHDYAAEQPIIDYHNHLSPEQVAGNYQFKNLTDAWLAGDHYKWRAMRANGIPEERITGPADDRDKFRAWAETVPYTARNPLYHWTHLELRRYFGIETLLIPDTAEEIYERAGEQLDRSSHFARGLLEQQRVRVICTTDHPTDSLEHHRAYAGQGHELLMYPTFRPDKFSALDQTDFTDFLAKLGEDIRSFDALIAALERRMDYFDELGCKLSDHGVRQLHDVSYTAAELDQLLHRRQSGQTIDAEEAAIWQTAVLDALAPMYHRRGWTMQFHLGPIRDTNTRLGRKLGADAGCDSIGDFPQAVGLVRFLDRLEMAGRLPRTILYNLNPRDNELFATMVGNYQDGSVPGKVQWGSAWWFLDQKDGMEKQLNTLSSMGLLSRFVGMLTDSRSFLSFPRHEYFRRILCNLIGTDVVNGELPNDPAWLGGMVADICYGNAARYFNFPIHDAE